MTISTKIQNGIINDYNNGITNSVLSKKYFLHRTTIQRILKRNKVKLKSINETSRKHIIVDENYFKIIDNEEKAYILGLLYADGYINKNGFGITLAEIDVAILNRISHIIYNKVVLGYKKAKNNIKPQYRLEVVSKIMKNDLIKHGCMERKTFKIQFPKLTNENIYRGFIRGYFDGDGCICIPTKNPNNITITLTSNTKFCNGLAEYVRNTVNVNMKSIVRYENVSITRLTGKKQIIKFMDWLYCDSTIYLKRKHDKYNNFKNLNTKLI